MSNLLEEDDVQSLIPSASPAWLTILVPAANSAAVRHAPCLAATTDQGLRAEAKIILLRAIERLTGTKDWIRAETRGPFSISYVTGGRGLLDQSDTAALAALCSAGAPALPVASFPRAADYDPLFARPRGWLA